MDSVRVFFNGFGSYWDVLECLKTYAQDYAKVKLRDSEKLPILLLKLDGETKIEGVMSAMKAIYIYKEK